MRIWIVLVIAAGCSQTAPSDPERVHTQARASDYAGPPALPVKPPTVPRIGERQIDVIVNDHRYTTLSPSELATGVRIDRLLSAQPYAKWESIAAYGPGVAPVEWLAPGTTRDGAVPLAFLAGSLGAVALVDPAHPEQRDVTERLDGIDEIRITIPKPPRTPLESLAAGCAPPPKGETQPEPTAKRWRGNTFQFNIPMHWRNDMKLSLEELVDSPIGTKIGTILTTAVEWDQVCLATLYRIADRNGRRAVVGRVRPGDSCVDAIMEFACDGNVLQTWAYYASNGQYVEHGALVPVK